MFKENKFHKLIEQQDSEKKKESLEVLNKQLRNNSVDDIHVNGNTVALIKTTKIIIPIICFALCLVLIIAIIITNSAGNDKAKMRFCAESDYSISDTDLTIKDYSLQTGKKLLFLDWYEETEDYADVVFVLNETGEIICLHETLYDMNTGYYVNIYITDNLTKLEFLNKYDACKNSYAVNGVEALWAGGSSSLAKFEYEGFTYYIQVESRMAPEAVLPILDELLL